MISIVAGDLVRYDASKVLKFGRMNAKTIQKAIERARYAAGFVFIRGWVRNEDAPKVRKLIAAAKDDVEKVKRDA